jgi:hypothetical protein
MQLRLVQFAILLTGSLLFWAVTVQAQVCTLTLATSGTLGLNTDGTVLGSEELGGVFGSVTIASVGANTVQIAAPTRISAPPAGYSSGSELVEVAYLGLGGLAVVNQPYTSATTNFGIGTIGASILQIHNRIYNPQGFAPGTYQTRTVVTCS